MSFPCQGLLELSVFLQTMDREFRKWMKWYGKKHAEYTVSALASCPVATTARRVDLTVPHPQGLS